MPDASQTGSSKSMDTFPIMKWEKRKRPSTAYAPCLRSGCTMAYWAAKNTGVMFGGVTDEDTHEETLESVFHNDLYVIRRTRYLSTFDFALQKWVPNHGKWPLVLHGT